MENKIYLVTGAAGFLGSHVCSQLLDRKERVRALVLPNDSSIKYIPKEVKICLGDLCDRNSLEQFFTVPNGMETIVIHCASMVTVNPDYNQKLIDINVGGTKNIIETCLAHKECKKLVYVGSTGAIPELPKGENVFSVPTECVAIVNGNDLRGLGIYNKHLAGIPGTGFLLNMQSYVRLHCLPVLFRI